MKNNTLKMLLISSSLFSISFSNFAHSTNLSQSFQLKNLFRSINVAPKNHPGTIKQSVSLKNMSGLEKLTPRYSIKTNTRTASPAASFANIFASSNARRAVAHTSPATNTKKAASPAASFANILTSLSHSNHAVKKAQVNHVKAQKAERTRLANEQAAQRATAERTRLANEQAAQRAAAERTRLANEQTARQVAAQQAERTRLANEQAAQRAAAERTRLANEQAAQRAAAQQAERTRLANEQAARQAAAQQAERTRLANEQAAQRTAAERTRLANEQAETRRNEIDRLTAEADRLTIEDRRILTSVRPRYNLVVPPYSGIGARPMPQHVIMPESQAELEAARIASEARQPEIQRLRDEVRRLRNEDQRIEAERIAAIQLAEAERIRLIEEAAEAERTRIAAAEYNRLAPAWAAMTERQKILALVDKVFEDPDAERQYGVPADPHKQAIIKNLFQQLMDDNTISTAQIIAHITRTSRMVRTDFFNTRPTNLRNFTAAVTSHVIKAVKIHNYESDPYRMPRQEAIDFIIFDNDYERDFKNFKLNTHKKLAFYRSLKTNLAHVAWNDIIETLTPILRNSLPLDYVEWPNFETNPGADFDNFIRNIITPAINAVRGQDDIEAAAEHYVQNLLARREQSIRTNIAQAINNYEVQNNNYINVELTNHGTKTPLINVSNDNFRTLTNQINNKLQNLENEARADPALRQRINFTRLCADPFLSLLRAPDARLIPIRQIYNANYSTEVQNFKTRILNLIPAQDRILDQEFNLSFVALDSNNSLNNETVVRLKRLYDCVKDNQGDLAAARVIYAFGAENSGRCIDGKRDRITELERQYVYVAGNQAATRNPDSIIGLNLSKLLMDDRMDKLRQTINTLYDAGEPRTYAWFRSHRALYLGFGISGKYDEMLYGGGHQEGINPAEFVEKYFKGGSIRGTSSTRVHNIEAFTVDKMATLVSNDIKKEMGGSFDDNTLDYMINTNLVLRRSYAEFKEHCTDDDAADYENNYFKNASLRGREAIKKEAIVEILKTYKYVYKRSDVNNMWE